MKDQHVIGASFAMGFHKPISQSIDVQGRRPRRAFGRNAVSELVKFDSCCPGASHGIRPSLIKAWRIAFKIGIHYFVFRSHKLQSRGLDY